MKESEARVLIARMAASWPRVEWSQANTDAYVSALVDLDADELAVAIETIRRMATFMPSIAEIRSVVAERRIGAPSEMEAFRQASTKGERHWAVDEARRLVGDDWHWRTAEERPLRFAFDRAYKEILKRERDYVVVGELDSWPAGVRELESA